MLINMLNKSKNLFPKVDFRKNYIEISLHMDKIYLPIPESKVSPAGLNLLTYKQSDKN